MNVLVTFKNPRTFRSRRSQTQAVQLKPNYDGAYYGRGKTRYELEDSQGAIEDFTQVIQLNPNHVGAYFSRGIAHSSLGDYLAALADFTQAIQLEPNDAVS